MLASKDLLNADILRGLIPNLTADEKMLLKTQLSSHIDDFFDNENQLKNNDTTFLMQFHSLAKVLKLLSENGSTIPDNGIVYYGQPDWLTAELLEQLQKEALKRRFEPLDRIDHFLGCGGQVADRLSTSTELTTFVSTYAGEVIPTGIASYLYYDATGLGIRPHVDTEIFSINLMLMLKHDSDKDKLRSSTIVFPANKPQEEYQLKIGEVMIMYGSSVIHTRSLIQENEIVHLLTIGFNPK